MRPVSTGFDKHTKATRRAVSRANESDGAVGAVVRVDRAGVQQGRERTAAGEIGVDAADIENRMSSIMRWRNGVMP